VTQAKAYKQTSLATGSAVGYMSDVRRVRERYRTRR